MTNKLFPKTIDNSYRGHRLALWLLGLLVLMKIAMGLNCIFNGHTVATNADGIPLDTFTANGARTVLAFFAIWGLGQVLLGLLGGLALVRYRSMLPLVFALMLIEQVGRKLILLFLPYPKVGTSPGLYVNLGFLALMIVGLTLSLWSRDSRKARD